MRGISFDIETADADQLHTYGPGFVRLCGWQDVTTNGPIGPVHTSPDVEDLIAALDAADFVTGHRIVVYDLLAVAKYHRPDGDWYERTVNKSFDALLVEQTLNPVAARDVQPSGYYGLEATAKRYGVAGKSTVDFEGKREIVRRILGDKKADRLKPGKTNSFGVLKLLKDLYGGYDKIPVDDPDYVEYLKQDVSASANLFVAQHKAMAARPAGDREYTRREHRMTGGMGRTTLIGMNMDVDLNLSRWSEGQARLDAGKRMLHDRFGMPLEGKKPHTTNLGRAAFRDALIATGISPTALARNWPTGKDGSLLTGKDVLKPMIELFDSIHPDTGEKINAQAADLCRTILAMNGERTVYGSFLAHTVNGRIHPYISPDQSSGRWSMRDPGVTVTGKRGGKATERAVILPDYGERLLCIDADQVDQRVIAAECQDPAYMAIFIDPNRDLHSEIAWQVFQNPACWEEMQRNNGRCDCELRNRAKACGHGAAYSMQAKTMSIQTGLPVPVCQAFLDGMNAAFPVKAQWTEMIRRMAGALPRGVRAPSDDAYRILRTWRGRPVRVERERAFTQSVGQIGQGGTRDVMAETYLKLKPSMRRRVRAVVHDEFVFSVPKGWTDDDSRELADGMGFDLRGVPITFGTSRLGDCWADCYSADYCPHKVAMAA